MRDDIKSAGDEDSEDSGAAPNTPAQQPNAGENAPAGSKENNAKAKRGAPAGGKVKNAKAQKGIKKRDKAKSPTKRR